MENVMNTNFEQLNREKEILDFKVKELTEIVSSQTEEIGQLGEEKSKLSSEISKLKEQVKYYEDMLRLNASRKFGASSEKTTPGQMKFEDISPETFSQFDEVEETVVEAVKPIEEPTVEKATRRRKGNVGANKPCFADLEVEEVITELKEEEKVCFCCNGKLHEIRRDVREEIVIKPVEFKKIQYVTVTYGCRECGSTLNGVGKYLPASFFI